MARTIHVLLVLDVKRSAETGVAVVHAFDDNPEGRPAWGGGVRCQVGDTLIWSAMGRVPGWTVAITELSAESGAVLGAGPAIDPRTGTWRARVSAPGEARCQVMLAANGHAEPFAWELSIHAAPAERSVHIGYISRPI